jgi:tripartite-type tricarboxylate transporter receptor subunit TctC
MRIGKFLAILAAAAVAWAPGWASAQAWPSKPVKIVVPFAAGGATDVVARLLAQKLSEAWGQTVIVENRAGAGGNIGADVVAKSPPDGYTLLMTSGSIVTANQHIYKQMSFDPAKDLVPITNVASGPQVIAINPNVPVKDLKELIAYAKANPGKLNYGSAGTGSATHLNMAWFVSMAGLDIVHVPYKGSTQARQDALAGQVQLVMDGLLPLQPLIKDGRLKALAITSSKRAQSNPEIPTIGEVVPGYATDTWYGILAPAGTPKDVVAKLNAAAVKALASPAVRDRLQKLGAEPVGNSPAEFRALLEKEQKTWARVVKDSGAKVE